MTLAIHFSSTRTAYFICLPSYPLDVIAEFLGIINSGCGFEESLVFRVKHKQGWVEWSWDSHENISYLGLALGKQPFRPIGRAVLLTWTPNPRFRRGDSEDATHVQLKPFLAGSYSVEASLPSQ